LCPDWRGEGSRFTGIEAYAGTTNLIFADPSHFFPPVFTDMFAAVVPLGTAPSPSYLPVSSAYFLADQEGLYKKNKSKVTGITI